MKSSERTPLPEGWGHDLMHKADLEKSFNDLEGVHHFHAYTMRGRIRTLQLRLDDAWKEFDRAEVLSRRAEECSANLRRTFLLHVYRFDNAVLEAPGSNNVEASEPWLPRLSESLLAEFPELRVVLRLRTRVQGNYLLHAGRWTDALQVFTGVAEDRDANSVELAQAYLSIACCYYNLGSDEQVQRFLESAELAFHACDGLLVRAHLCGLLYAVHIVRGDANKAEEWREFLYSLPCPQATKDGFFALGERFVSFCDEYGRLVVF